MSLKTFIKNSLWIALLMIPYFAQAQFADIRVKDNSPYSRLGMGDLFNQNFTNIRSMGGLSAAFNDPMQVNLQNPASLGFLKATTFEAGLFGNYTQLSDSDQTADIWNSNIGYLSLGFATKNQLNQVLDRKSSPWGWGMNFTLLPFSDVNYGVELTSAVQDTINVVNTFQGSGGTNRIIWGNGVRYKNLSVGLNLGYLFGKINNDRTLDISEAGSYGVITEKGISLRGFTWNAGAQYNHIFKKKTSDGEVINTGKILSVGAFGNSGTSFNTESTLLEYRSNNSFFDRDTLTNQTGLEQEGMLPSQLGIGFIYGKTNEWKIGANYTLGNWSEYFNEGIPEGQELNDSWELGVGGEFIPDNGSYNRYYKKIRYRAGIFYGKDPRLDLNNYGVSFGFGLPIVLPRQTVSFVNLGIEIGQLTGTDDTLLKENYVNFTAGFTLNDNSWFFKRKFN